MKARLPVSTFEFPLAEFRRGYRSAIYFSRAKNILEHEKPHRPTAVMQVFQKNKAILCGMDEAIAVLKTCTGYWSDGDKAASVFDSYMIAKMQARKDPLNIEKASLVIELEQALEALWTNTYEDLEVEALFDGDVISPWEPVLRIKGPYSDFAHLESIYLGILARATKVATNVRKVVSAAQPKQVLFFADRFDRWGNQGADGYAAHIGGASGVASDAMADWWGSTAIGTMPHALIAMYGGNTADAAVAFNKMYPDVYTTALVDFNNDTLADTLACREALDNALWGVRLDTSENMVDPLSLHGSDVGRYKPTGVNPILVRNLRSELDSRGHHDVKIVVSGGFNEEKINSFKLAGVHSLIDAYAVGEAFFEGKNSFTADIVDPISKKGRKDDGFTRLFKVN